MTSSISPEKRVDKNGHLVTRHVKTGSEAKPELSIPAPAIPPAPAVSEARFEQRQWNVEWQRKYPTFSGLKLLFEGQYFYSSSKFECSDMEAYEVLRVSHGTNALVLLAGGIRSRENAIELYEKNDLTHLIENNDEWVDQVIARDLPAQPVLNMAGSYGSHAYRNKPQFLDALEANCVRALRDAESYPTIPDRIMNGEISLEDIRTIGATRLAKAARKGPAVRLLMMINSGKVDYGAEELKAVIVKYEGTDSHRILDPLTMTQYYGAETMLNLRYFHRAAEFITGLPGIRDRKESAKIVTYNDDLYHYGGGRIAYSNSDVFLLCESGATAYDAVQSIKNGMTPLQVAAIAQEVPSSVSGGWL